MSPDVADFRLRAAGGTIAMSPTPVLVSWSSGKDSAWALHGLRQQPETWDVRGVFTTVTPAFDRVSVHGTPRWVLAEQARRLGLPLYEIEIPYPCTNDLYEAATRGFLQRVGRLPEARTAQHLAFGDLFLEDIRAYREDLLAGTGFTAVFPVWGSDTARLARTMIASGLRAVVNAVNPLLAPAEIAGRWFDRELLAALPAEVDPLAERGEFHTCVLDGPMFSAAVPARVGEIVRRPVASDPDDDGTDDGSASTRTWCLPGHRHVPQIRVTQRDHRNPVSQGILSVERQRENMTGIGIGREMAERRRLP